MPNTVWCHCRICLSLTILFEVPQPSSTPTDRSTAKYLSEGQKGPASIGYVPWVTSKIFFILLSTAVFGVPRKICAESYWSAVQKFEDQRGGSTCLKEVHFVDVSDAMVTLIQQTFIAKLNTTTGQEIAATHNKVSNRHLSVVKSRGGVPH